jgi:hypothetical protein
MQANLAVMQTLQEEIGIIEKRLMERVKLRPDYALLNTVPGIGPVLATTIMLEIGTTRMGRFDVLVDKAVPMDFAERCGNADRQPHESVRFERRAQQPLEWLAARVLEYQHGPIALTHELERPHRPCTIQLVL